MDNDKKVQEYRNKQIGKWLLVTVYIIIIVLEILALCNVINMLWGCGLFVIAYLFKKIFLK